MSIQVVVISTAPCLLAVSLLQLHIDLFNSEMQSIFEVFQSSHLLRGLVLLDSLREKYLKANQLISLFTKNISLL